MIESSQETVGACPSCRTPLAPRLRACPNCGHLVHGAELKRLSAEAQTAETEGRVQDALVAWRQAMDLLPGSARQHETIRAHVEKLGQTSAARAAPPGQAPGTGAATDATKKPRERLGKKVGALGVVGLIVWKFKFVVVAVFSKLKLILLGLGKAKTLFTMMLSFGVYWTLWGWPFALGLVVMIYIHEMGHVWALRRYGIAATAPMFVPGLGAFIRTKQYPASARENAEVGLAGPMWGMAGAAVGAAIYFMTGSTMMAAIAGVAAWINFFNLVPVFGLDGSHGFTALARRDRLVVAAAMLGAFLVTRDGLILVIALVAGWRAFDKAAPPVGDRRTLIEFVLIIAGLAALILVRPSLG